MLYAIIGTKIPTRGANRHPTRPRHLERVQALVQQGRLAMAGPFPAVDAMEPRLAVGAHSLRPAIRPDLEPGRAGPLDARRLRGVLP